MKAIVRKALDIYQNFSARQVGCNYGLHSSLYFDALVKAKGSQQRPLFRDGAYVGTPVGGPVLQKLIDRVNSDLQKTENFLYDSEGGVICRTIDDYSLESDEVDLILNSEMKEAMSIGHNFLYKIHRVTAWTNYGYQEFGNAETFSNRYHFDCDPASIVKVFLYLSDVDKDTGPFTYIPRAATVNICRDNYRYRSGQSESYIKELDQSAQSVVGPVGHIFAAMPARVLHRAQVPMVGKSRTLVQVELRM